MRLHVEKKLSPKVHLWRKNDKYEVCLVMIPNKQQFEYLVTIGNGLKLFGKKVVNIVFGNIMISANICM